MTQLGERPSLAATIERARKSLAEHPPDDPESLSRLRAADRATRKMRLEAAGAIGRVTDAMLDAIVADVGLRDTEPLQSVRAWLREQNTLPPVLGLLGTVGTGKSVAAAWAVAEKGGGLWMSAPRLLRVYSGRYPDSLREQDRIREAHVLVIDDVGRETDGVTNADEQSRLRGALAHALLEVLDDRQNRTRRTIVSGNMPVDRFRKLYCNARLSSRLNEIAALHEFVGEDMRAHG